MTSIRVRNALVLVVTTLVILVGVWAVQTQFGAAPTVQPGAVTSVSVASDVPAPTVGDLAADFTGTALDGSTVTLSELRGQPVWLVFQATWCADCRAEAPDVATLATTYAGRAQVVSVYVGEDAATVKAYADKLSLTYPQVPDQSQQIASAYRVMGIPSHFFLDSSGVIRSIRVGVLSPADASAELDALLG